MKGVFLTFCESVSLTHMAIMGVINHMYITLYYGRYCGGGGGETTQECCSCFKMQ